MTNVLGLIALFACVFGVFIFHGGNPDVLVKALPGEMVTILGAGLAAMMIANRPEYLVHTAKGVVRTFRASKWKQDDFLDVIVLVSTLLKKFRNEGPKSIESDIEVPHESPLFKSFPRLLNDSGFTLLVTDTVRMMVASTGTLNPYAVEELMDSRIKSVQSYNRYAYNALTTLAGALPALGIVACVLGIVKTMASIDQPPAILGELIGAALLGTFLGVFLAYGIVEPIAKRLAQLSDDDAQICHVAKQIIVASLHGHPQPMVIEAARASIHQKSRPSFEEVFERLMKREENQVDHGH